jgi:PmbA protein
MPQSSPTADALNQLHDLIGKARKAGADAADALLVDATALSVTWRSGKLEALEQAESGDLGLRVLIGKKQAIVSTTDRRAATLDELVERAVAMAKAALEDEFCGIADASEIAKSWPEMELADTYDVAAPTLIERAKQAEEAALAVKGVAQCEGADASASQATVALAASNGFAGHYTRTSYGISASVLAGEGTSMEQDYDFASCVFQSDLPSASSIGKQAGERAVRLLGARKMPTCQVSVVFDPRKASGLLGHLAGAISGAGVARGTSFLKDKLGQAVFSDSITIIDDPFRARGLRSRSFDGEGLLPSRRKIIDRGVLTTWLLDLHSARQLKMKSTGHASRGAGSVPSPSPHNFYCEPGSLTPAELMRDIKQGLYVTELMGAGVNGVTGDYSRAAKGFWIENGVIAFPVNELTIAGNLKDMFLNLTAANDLAFRYGLDAPTLRVEGMTVAGV